MKKKKYNYKLTGIVLIIAGIAGLIILQLILHSQPQFIIEKEECKEEDIDFQEEDILTIIPTENISYYDIRVFNQTLKLRKCERVEVDEIDLKFLGASMYWDIERDMDMLSRLETYCKKKFFDTAGYVDKCVSEIENPIRKWMFSEEVKPTEMCCYEKISKSDLSLEWLEENCECLESDCGTVCVYEVDNAKELSEFKKQEGCLKFKCFEYFVRKK